MQITTLTVNPAIDKSAKVNGLVPDVKQQCHTIKYHPGGGGINISRVLNKLGTNSTCVFPSGGHSGIFLQQMLLKENISLNVVSTKAFTRENFSVVDTQTQLQYRFGMPGCALSNTELNELKNCIMNKVAIGGILVFSGSLTSTMSSDYYAQFIKSVKKYDVKIVVDTAGEPLKKAVHEGVYLMKPNQRELAQLAGVEELTTSGQEKFAMQLVHSKKAVLVAVSLGARGAFLASKNGIIYQSTPSVKVKSTIGAGDSMVAGLIYGIRNNFTEKEILKWGIACGVATTLTEGSELANKPAIDKIMKMLR